MMLQRGLLVRNAAIFLPFQALSVLCFGFPAVRDFSHSYVGLGTDPTIFSWSLVWWPYALSHGLNPFVTSFAYAPWYNLTWTPSMPAASLLAYPITRAFGPIVSQNALALMAPALAAWAAFSLCFYLSNCLWSSLLGGYVFGFSPYFAGQLCGHLPIVLVFPVPLAVYLTVRRFDGSLSVRSFVVFQALLISLFALLWIEGLATATIFGGMALLVALSVLRDEQRRRLWNTTLHTTYAYVLAVVILTPWFYYTFARGVPHGPVNPPEAYSADLLNFLVPTVVSFAYRLPIFRPLAAALNPCEMTAYLGLGLLVVAVVFPMSSWKQQGTRILTYSLVLICLASLGPKLHISGKAFFLLPWAVFVHIPLVNNALPGRFMMYAFLCLAIMTSICLARLSSGRSKVLLGTLILISSLPNVGSGVWSSSIPIPPFFTQKSYRKYLRRGDTVLIFPFGGESYEMLWQALSDMYFRIAGGHLTLPPPEYQRWPILSAFLTGDLPMDTERQLACFLTTHNVSAVLVEAANDPIGRSVMSVLRVNPVEDGGVLIYRLPTTLDKNYPPESCRQVPSQYAFMSFTKYIEAANEYWKSGQPIAALTPERAAELKFLILPGQKTVSRNDESHWLGKAWLGPWVDVDHVAIGWIGAYRDLRTVVDTYKYDATEVFFPFPEKVDKPSDDTTGQLLMTFTKEGLNRAAARSTVVENERSNP